MVLSSDVYHSGHENCSKVMLQKQSVTPPGVVPNSEEHLHSSSPGNDENTSSPNSNLLNCEEHITVHQSHHCPELAIHPTSPCSTTVPRVSLPDLDLWSLFHQVSNEMIVTRDGRRMFPVLKVKVSGLEPTEMYKIQLDFKLVDQHRWKYINGEWAQGTRSEVAEASRLYTHPDSPNYGSHWMESTIAFARTKITNKDGNDANKIFLNSMYKYVPRIHIAKISADKKGDELVGSYSFPETEFIAVTAYQNESVTFLKVQHNPFAKAFQEPRDSTTGSISSYRETPFISHYYGSKNGALTHEISNARVLREREPWIAESFSLPGLYRTSSDHYPSLSRSHTGPFSRKYSCSTMDYHGLLGPMNNMSMAWTSRSYFAHNGCSTLPAPGYFPSPSINGRYPPPPYCCPPPPHGLTYGENHFYCNGASYPALLLPDYYQAQDRLSAASPEICSLGSPRGEDKCDKDSVNRLGVLAECALKRSIIPDDHQPYKFTPKKLEFSSSKRLLE